MVNGVVCSRSGAAALLVPVLSFGLAFGLLGGSAALGEPLVFNLDGAESWDQEGSPLNTVLDPGSVPLAGYAVTRVDWDLSLTTIDGSFASEARMVVLDGQQNRMMFLRPALGDDWTVSGVRYVGSMDLAAIGADFTLSHDGLLLELYESFDDHPGAVDAVWSGTVTFNVPGVGGAGLLGAGGLLAGQRRWG